MIISLRRPVFHTALALSAGLPLCQRDVMCLIFTGSPLTCCSGGDAHPTCHVAAEAASQSSNRSEHTYATEYKNNKINKPQANCDSLTTSSGNNLGADLTYKRCCLHEAQDNMWDDFLSRRMTGPQRGTDI